MSTVKGLEAMGLVLLAASEAVTRALPDARLVALDDSGHVPYVEAPDDLFGAVRDFLQQTAARTTLLTRT